MELRGGAVTAVGKHVCGAATDLMLRCVVAPSGQVPRAQLPAAAVVEEEAVAVEAVLEGQVAGAEKAAVGATAGSCEEAHVCRGIGVALCCHHLCNWEDYVNPGFVTRADLSPEDFGTVCRLSCWATSDRSATGDPSRQAVGMTCKAFLDVGRCLYLREHGFDANLTAYCSTDETPENRLLIAKWVGHEPLAA